MPAPLPAERVRVDVQGIFGLIFMLMIVGWILTIWALADAIRVPDDSMYRAGTKLVWVLVILLGNLIGSIVYFAIGRPAVGCHCLLRRSPSDRLSHAPAGLQPCDLRRC